jgi:hypothetical protein
MIFLVNNQTLDDALSDNPHHNQSQNQHHNQHYNQQSYQNHSKVNGHHNQPHFTKQQILQHQQFLEKEESNRWKDALSRLCAVLGFIFFLAGIALLAFGIIKSNLPCLIVGPVGIVLGAALGVVCGYMVYQNSGKVSGLKLRRTNRLRPRV